MWQGLGGPPAKLINRVNHEIWAALWDSAVGKYPLSTRLRSAFRKIVAFGLENVAYPDSEWLDGGAYQDLEGPPSRSLAILDAAVDSIRVPDASVDSIRVPAASVDSIRIPAAPDTPPSKKVSFISADDQDPSSIALEPLAKKPGRKSQSTSAPATVSQRPSTRSVTTRSSKPTTTPTNSKTKKSDRAKPAVDSPLTKSPQLSHSQDKNRGKRSASPAASSINSDFSDLERPASKKPRLEETTIFDTIDMLIKQVTYVSTACSSDVDVYRSGEPPVAEPGAEIQQEIYSGIHLWRGDSMG